MNWEIFSTIQFSISLSSHILSKHIKIKMHKTSILHFVLYGCMTWSLTLRDEYELKVLQKKGLRKIFG
jgi:hypothetical protein